MSTLNRALSKIYGQDGSKSGDAERDCPAGPSAAAEQRQVTEAVDSVVPAAHLRFPCQPAFSTNEENSDEDLVGFAGADVAAPDGQEVSNSTGLTGAIVRIDGPCSSVTSPPHFELVDLEKDDPFEAPEPAVESVVESAAEAADTTDPADATEAKEDALVTTEIDLAGEQPHDEQPHDEQHAATRTAIAELTAEHQPIPVVALHPEWEVDGFRWPETCQRLLLEKEEVLQAAVESLCQMSPGDATIVGLVGEQAGDGVSTMALCIARCASQLGRRVIIVDADISSPSLATILGLNTPCSWHDSIISDAPLTESVVLSVEDQLCMMPLHLDCQQSDFRLTDKRVAALWREASASNDLIIVDCGAIERLRTSTDMRDGTLPCDLAVVVRDASRERTSLTDETLDTLRQLRVEHVMFAENFVHFPKPSDGTLKNSAA